MKRLQSILKIREDESGIEGLELNCKKPEVMVGSEEQKPPGARCSSMELN